MWLSPRNKKNQQGGNVRFPGRVQVGLACYEWKKKFVNFAADQNRARGAPCYFMIRWNKPGGGWDLVTDVSMMPRGSNDMLLWLASDSMNIM